MLAIAGPTSPAPVYDKYNPFRQYNWQYQPQKPPSPKPVVKNDVQLPNAFDWFKQDKNEKSSHEEIFDEKVKTSEVKSQATDKKAWITFDTPEKKVHEPKMNAPSQVDEKTTDLKQSLVNREVASSISTQLAVSRIEKKPPAMVSAPPAQQTSISGTGATPVENSANRAPTVCYRQPVTISSMPVIPIDEGTIPTNVKQSTQSGNSTISSSIPKSISPIPAKSVTPPPIQNAVVQSVARSVSVPAVPITPKVQNLSQPTPKTGKTSPIPELALMDSSDAVAALRQKYLLKNASTAATTGKDDKFLASQVKFVVSSFNNTISKYEAEVALKTNDNDVKKSIRSIKVGFVGKLTVIEPLFR